jgi:putative flavoprotein involved in K+ transport
MGERHEVIVVGAGHAGLTMSWTLRERGLEHVVLERDRIGERWRTSRWDSLMFQFPNTVLALPGMPYVGDDPSGFAHRADVLRLIEKYAVFIDAPVREHTAVEALDRAGDGWRVRTPDAELHARAVVVASGPFQKARVPEMARKLPERITQLHSVEYKNPDRLPAGGVLVVGSGASGAQIAEELLEAGRRVWLCVSRHRRVPRRFRGRDITDWLLELGIMDRTRADWVDGRMPPTVLVTGVGGGHDLDVRKLGERGCVLLGSLRGSDGERLHLADDAKTILAAADEMYDELARRLGMDVVKREPRPTREPVTTLSLAGITSVVWCTGFDFDFDWLHAPCLDASGAPIQTRGVTDVPGLYFLGLHWMHTFKSGTFMGIADDAAHVADHLASFLGR